MPPPCYAGFAMIFSPPHMEDGARWAGMRVGLLGGSFNPPHKGHVHASLIAMKALQLDAVWWLVSPQNPLKKRAELSFDERFALCRQLVEDPRIIVTELERGFGTNKTWETIRECRRHFPQAQFVWISGIDNALTMHRWHNWRYILDNVATAHIARPPAWSLIGDCPLKMLTSQRHFYLQKAQRVPLLPRHTYWILQTKLMGISSTQIRNSRNKATKSLE